MHPSVRRFPASEESTEFEAAEQPKWSLTLIDTHLCVLCLLMTTLSSPKSESRCASDRKKNTMGPEVACRHSLCTAIDANKK